MAIASEILLARFDRDGNYRFGTRQGRVGSAVGPFFFSFFLLCPYFSGTLMPFRPWSAPVEGCRHARTPGAEVHRLLGKGCLMALVLVDDGSTDDVESTALEIQYRCLRCGNSTRRHSRPQGVRNRVLGSSVRFAQWVSYNFYFPRHFASPRGASESVRRETRALACAVCRSRSVGVSNRPRPPVH